MMTKEQMRTSFLGWRVRVGVPLFVNNKSVSASVLGILSPHPQDKDDHKNEDTAVVRLIPLP